ncbi:peptide-N(4)-(N-acetyl-beta-glucosaminyl)asparagine amidase-like [Salmo trutta]|uniref:peptide-N(4)-(N-acetyl-beta- glucosaminyl)asparagine amidase-like n=1 Tax=Salmo trutta TaxID=8032 RepID=UPI00112FE166|nr:peptide-N(4)-(N-acetyl-beta-glucosaminyl)asparagine amidase-like [Salmo trutta]
MFAHMTVVALTVFALTVFAFTIVVLDDSAAAAEFVFVPSGRVFHLRYNSTKDHYCRVSSDNEDIQGQDCVEESVFRKLKNDWQMVYLARTEGSSSGNIRWKLDCAPVGMKIKTVSVRTCSQTFHCGTGRWGLQSGQNTTSFSGGGWRCILFRVFLDPWSWSWRRS